MNSAELAELVLPAKQARSRRTRDRLLAAGRELLNRGAFDATSINDVARDAGCSVGAFYQRFPDKEAFFTVVIETVLADIALDAKRFVTDERLAEGSVEVAIAQTVRYWTLPALSRPFPHDDEKDAAFRGSLEPDP